MANDGERPEIHLALFRDKAELDAFGSEAVAAFHSCLETLELAGLRLGSIRQAVMVGRLVIKMLEYKSEQAAEAAPQGLDVVDAEIAELWPVFSRFVDAEIANSAQVVGKLQEALKDKAND